MIDVEWNDNAKAAVREFADYIGQSDKCERYLEAFETKKTVADAVEWAKGVWGDYNYGYISYNPNTEQFSYTSSDVNRRWYIVCTRAEFEAYVKEQEGEKWTHTYSDYGVRKDCILIHDKPDIHGQVLVVNRYDEYALTDTVEQKPIKQKLTKAEAWDKIMQNKMNSAEVNTIKQKYDII